MKFLKVGFLYNDNSIDPFIPEWWAQETLAILEEEMVLARLVNRDFEKYFNKFGDVVNTRRPGEFVGTRKVKTDNVVKQDATATNVAVTLDQHCYVAFAIKDAEETMSMKNLIDTYAKPAGLALARMVDRIVASQYVHFLANNAGGLNSITSANVKDKIIDLRQVMDDNKAYENGRNLILTSKTEADALRPEWFTSADKIGGTGGIRDASLGHLLGFDFYKSLNMPNVLNYTATRTFQINLAAGYVAGTTSALVIDTGTGEITVGSWVSIGGQPYRVTARSGTAPTIGITLEVALKYAVADNDPIIVYTPGAVNLVAGYAAGWSKEIVVDGFTVAPKVGQLVTFGTTSTRYAIISVNGTTGITLDRPLEATIADDAAVNVGPNGAFNLAFHKDAMTLAIRPLRPVISGAGARSAEINYNGLSMRATISYDPDAQEHMWVLDFLAGIKVLDSNLGAVLLG